MEFINETTKYLEKLKGGLHNALGSLDLLFFFTIYYVMLNDDKL